MADILNILQTERRERAQAQQTASLPACLLPEIFPSCRARALFGGWSETVFLLFLFFPP